MKRTKSALFATQIYQQKMTISKTGSLKELLSEIGLIQKSDLPGIAWSKHNYAGGYTSYGSLDKLHKFSSTFENLRLAINPHVDNYLKNLDYEASTKKNLTMTNCWVNVMPASVSHPAHIHPQAVISGTFYVTLPKGSSPIKFEDPRLGFMMNAPSLKLTTKLENKRFVSLQLQPGDLVLFESWLRHEVPANASKTPRVSISFNYGWV